MIEMKNVCIGTDKKTTTGDPDLLYTCDLDWSLSN